MATRIREKDSSKNRLEINVPHQSLSTTTGSNVRIFMWFFSRKVTMTRKRLKERTLYWQKKLGLETWKIDIEFDEKEFPEDGDGWETTAAVVRSNSTYKFATVYYNPKKLHVIEDSTIIHELLHVVSAPFTNFVHDNLPQSKQERARYHKEQMTTDLERIITKIYDR